MARRWRTHATTRSLPRLWRAAPGFFAAVSLGLCASACRDRDGASSDDSSPPPATSTSSDTEGSTGIIDEPDSSPSDLCVRAPSIGPGVHEGALRGYSADLGGACGLGGPDAFYRLDVPRRSDVKLRGVGAQFVPRVGVLPHACTEEWHDRTLLCDQGVGTWLLDVPAGSSLVVSVGIDSEHEALGLPPPVAGPDPLSFALEVRLRNVLGPGDACEPAERGRCGAGTACVTPPPPPTEPNAPTGPAVCTVLAADTCATATELALDVGVTTVQIDPTTLHTDAHLHSCGGARRAERVLRLQLPPDGPHTISVEGDRAGVGLALRGPDCSADSERACAAADDTTPPSLVAEVADDAAFLFVELPPAADDDGGSTGDGTTGGDGGEEAPILVTVEVSAAAADPGRP